MNSLHHSQRRSLSTAIIWFLSIALGCFVQIGSAQTVAKVDATPYSVHERGLNRRVMSKVISSTDADGKVTTKTNSYTELATGLHYLQDGKLVESKAEITLLPQGGAAATQGQHKAFLPANLNGGVINLVMPDGKELKSQIRGLGYYDKATGKNVVLAEVRDTEGTLYPPNVVVYENAFNGLHADVRYTYRRSGFEQDVILREQPPTPRELGLGSDTTRMEVMTEFIQPPMPEKQTVGMESKASDPDQSLNFGAMKIVRGRAFSIGEPSRTNRPVGVSKSWEQIDGRPFLIEQVDYHQISPQLDTLPKPPKGANLNSPGKNSKIGRMASSRQLPQSKLAAKSSKPLRLAQAKEAVRPGFLVDYPIQLNPTENNFTFEEGKTYYVVGDGPGGAILTGETTIESGAVVKSRFDDPYQGYDQYVLLLEGTLVCDALPHRPAVFTDWCDDSVGETIDESTGYPNPTYPHVIAANGGTIPSWVYKNLKFMQGQPSIFVGNTANTTTVNVRNCQFLGNTVDGVVAQVENNGSLDLKNSLFSLDGTAVSIVGSGVGFNAQNITAERFSTFVTGAGSPNIKDSLFIGGGQLAGTPTFTSTKSSSAGVFQSGSLGNYYLNPNDTWVAQNLIDQGSQTSPSAGLDNFTTRVDNTWDNGRVDRGFHYAGFLNLQASCNKPKIVLAWTLPQWLSQLGSGYISDFIIYRCDSTSGSCTPASLYATISNPSATSFDDTSVVSGHTYCYRITFRHQVGSLLLESPFSNTSCSTLCCHSADGDTIWVDASPTAAGLAGFIMAGTGITVVSGTPHFEGKPGAAGIFGNGLAAGLAYDGGVILSSGQISRAPGPNDNTKAGNNDPTDNTPGDGDLNALVSGLTTKDAAVLTFKITSSTQKEISFDYIFASEEYSEWIDQFNDIIGIFIQKESGTKENVALIPGTTEKVAVNTIHNGGGQSGNIPPSHPEFFQNNEPERIHVPFDGLITGGPNHYLTTVSKTILANTTYTIKIAIADANDQIYDSAVFLKAQVPCPSE